VTLRGVALRSPTLRAGGFQVHPGVCSVRTRETIGDLASREPDKRIPMIGFFARLFGGAASCCYVGHWCDTPVKFSNQIETPLGSKVTKVTVCVDIWYSVDNDQIIIERTRLSKRGSSLADRAINVATTRGEAFYANSICDEPFLRQAVENDLKNDVKFRKRMLAKWHGEHGLESK
jgi:hypothetical protein